MNWLEADFSETQDSSSSSSSSESYIYQCLNHYHTEFAAHRITNWSDLCTTYDAGYHTVYFLNN